MKRTLPPSVAALLFILPGLGLAALGLSSLKESQNLHTDLNPLAIQKSAYGKLLARLSETTIDRVWHLGVEQIVPHIISGDDHGEEHEATEMASAKEETAKMSRKAPVEEAKLWLNGMRYVKYHRTNPYSLNTGHLATVKKELEQMLLNSYKMDPLHYGAYNSYHLFLTTHSYGGTAETMAKARLVAKLTIQEALKETEDPEAYLTGAAAALNLFFMDSNRHHANGTYMSIEEIRSYRDRIDHLITRFETLQDATMDNGIWENLSIDRQMEITERSRFAKRSFKQFDAMIARLAAPSRGTIEEEVAELLDLDSL